MAVELLEEYRYLGSRNPIPAGDMNTMRRYGFGSLAAVPGQPTALSELMLNNLDLYSRYVE